MKFKKIRRIGAVVLSAALSACALAMFAGCTSTHPEVTVTYTFNNKDYQVDYVLSRTDAPQTVTHFLELADAGYYNGLCVHNYTANFLYTGGYRLVDEDGVPYDYSADNGRKTFELKEVDYFTEVKGLETDSFKFTQSVWRKAGTGENPLKGEPLYTLRNESAGNVNNEYGRDYSHSQGALVMYYTDKGNFGQEVTIERADGGAGNGGQPLQYEDYNKNSATALFYTYLSSSSNYERGQKYCVFGMAKNYTKQLENGLLKAIRDYEDAHADDEEFSFTSEQIVKINTYEPFEELAKEGRTNESGDGPYATPIQMPIIVKSVKVTKY